MKNFDTSTIIFVSLLFIMASCKKEGEPEPEVIPTPAPTTCSDCIYNGRHYNTVKIGDQCWMAEGFDYQATSGSWEIPWPDEFEGYGHLYNFTAARLNAPDGWHLPTIEDWRQLAKFISDEHGGYEIASEDYEWLGVGGHLKAAEEWGHGWMFYGTDDYGFKALPAGSRETELSLGTSSYDPRKQYTFYWTSTEEQDGRVRIIMLKYDSDSFYTTWMEEVRLYCDGLSVRYVKD